MTMNGNHIQQVGDKLANVTALSFSPSENVDSSYTTAIPFENQSHSILLVSPVKGLRLVGFSAKGVSSCETILRHGTSVDSRPILFLDEGYHETSREWFPELDSSNGIYLEIIKGTISIVLYTVQRS